MLTMEHRWGNRHEVSRSVRVAMHSGVVGRGVIRNVSTSGAFVEAPLPVNLFTYVKVQFNSALDGRPMMVEGQVVRKEPTGFAVEWRELAPAVLEALVSRPARTVQSAPPRLVFQRAATATALSQLSVD